MNNRDILYPQMRDAFSRLSFLPLLEGGVKWQSYFHLQRLIEGGIQSSNYGEKNPHPSQSNAGDK